MNSESLALIDTLLPPGRTITADGRPVLWLSDEPAPLGLWKRIRAEHPRTGLWPLLLEALDPRDDDFRPWASDELSPAEMSSPADHDPAALLARWWQEHTGSGDDPLPPAVTAPFGQLPPGLAPAAPEGADPGKTADEHADFFASFRDEARLGLVAAASGADALAAVGWTGPVNYDGDTAKFSAVLRSWEERFGARVVAVGFATLHLSVAAPPASGEDALAIAAEHFAFCPDNILQDSRYRGLSAYAEGLVGASSWDFWWD
ncbi:DUF4253 domain-containing protein [Streptomyces sp. NPDC003691]